MSPTVSRCMRSTYSRMVSVCRRIACRIIRPVKIRLPRVRLVLPKVRLPTLNLMHLDTYFYKDARGLI